MTAAPINDDRVPRLIDAWYAERLARGYSPGTMMMQRTRVRRAALDLDLLAADPEQVRAWLGTLDVSPDNRRTHLAALRGFADWLVAHHHRSDSFLDAEPVLDRDARLIEQWQIAMTARAFSPRTLYTRKRQLTLFAESHGLLEADLEDLEVYLAAMVRLAPETLKSVLSGLRSFYKWAYRHGHLPYDPAALLDPVRVAPNGEVTRACPDEVLAAAMDRCESDSDRLMLLLARLTGLRIAEVARVRASDLHGERLTVLGKGRKRRVVPVGPELAAMIREAAGDTGWVFPSPNRPGEPLTADNLGRRVSELLGEGWTAHTLRHRYATNAYKGTKDLFAVQRLLGHASPVTTRRYVYTDDDALAEAAAAGRGEVAPPGAAPDLSGPTAPNLPPSVRRDHLRVVEGGAA